MVNTSSCNHGELLFGSTHKDEPGGEQKLFLVNYHQAKENIHGSLT